MNPIDFSQRNLMLAEDQPEYQTLPCCVEYKNAHDSNGETPIKVPWSITCVFELSDEEIEELKNTKKLFYRQSVFGQSFQPMFFSTKDPYQPGNEQYWPAE